MANIAQVSRLSGAGQGLLSIMIEQNPILRVAEFKLDPSTYQNYPDSLASSGSAARGEGDAIQSDAQAPIGVSKNLALYGRQITIDDVRKLDQNITGSPTGLKLIRQRRQRSLAKLLATEVCDDMTAGTDANDRMLGLTTLIKDANAAGQTAALGFTTAQQAAMLTQAAMTLDTDAHQNDFMELLDKEIQKVPGANALLMNGNLWARMNTIARRLHSLGQSIDQFGVPVATYNNIPMIPVTTTGIPSTEDDGVAQTNTSLYIVRFAEDLGTAFSTNSGFYFQDFPDDDVNPDAKSRLQFFLNLAVDATDAVRRLSRIKLA